MAHESCICLIVGRLHRSILYTCFATALLLAADADVAVLSITVCAVLQGSWKAQGPDFAVPSRDPESLVGRRLWRHFSNTGWAPGTVTEYLAPGAVDAGAHVITFNADTPHAFEERMNIMQPTELVRLQLTSMLCLLECVVL